MTSAYTLELSAILMRVLIVGSVPSGRMKLAASIVRLRSTSSAIDVVPGSVLLTALWIALAPVASADEPDDGTDDGPPTVSSQATDALQDAATLRPRVVRWRQQVQPGYPPEERTHGWPAQHCRCVFTLGADGVPRRVEVTECAAPFQAAATRALLEWRTYPLDVAQEGDVVVALVNVDFAVPGNAAAPTNPTPSAPAAVTPPPRTPAPAAPKPTADAAPAGESEDARLARLRVEADTLARDIAADKAAFEAQVIESDWYGGERTAVVRWLLDQAASAPASADSTPMFSLPTDRAELARRLGTSVGVLQRVLHLTDTLGATTVHGDVVVVRDWAALTRLLGPGR